MVLVVVMVPFCLMAQMNQQPRKSIMIFGSHADDLEQMAGGTFAKFIAEGYEGVYVCVMNNLSGNQVNKVPGNWDFVKEKTKFILSSSSKIYQVGALETMQTRSEEARSAAGVFGSLPPVFLDFNEPELWLGRKLVVYGTKEFKEYDPPGRKQISLATRYDEDIDLVVDLLKKYQPEIVIIHPPGAEKLDHGNSGYLMYEAFKKAMQRSIPVGKLWMRVNGWLLDNKERGKPDVHIDIKNYLETKYEALNRHLSQNGGEGRVYSMSNQTQPKEVIEEFITVIDNTKPGKQ